MTHTDTSLPCTLHTHRHELNSLLVMEAFLHFVLEKVGWFEAVLLFLSGVKGHSYSPHLEFVSLNKHGWRAFSSLMA